MGKAIWRQLIRKIAGLPSLMRIQLEKYRPTLLGDIVGNTEAVARLQIIAEEGNMPNMILAVRIATWEGRPWEGRPFGNMVT